MKTSALALLLLFLSASAGLAGDTPVWHDDLASARRAASSGDRLVFVDLQADWCQWCRVLEEKVFPTKTFLELAEDRLVLLRVDTEDGSEGSHLQLRYDATSLPTALLLTPELALAGRVVGYADADEYVRRLRAEIASWEAFEARLPARLASEDTEELLALAEELMTRRDGEGAARALARAVELGHLPEETLPWVLYQRADALRMAERWEDSSELLEEGLTRARSIGDLATAERLALLRYQIARDRGDCRAERLALERFIDEYPESDFGSLARQTLQQIDRSQDPTCS